MVRLRCSDVLVAPGPVTDGSARGPAGSERGPRLGVSSYPKRQGGQPVKGAVNRIRRVDRPYLVLVEVETLEAIFDRLA